MIVYNQDVFAEVKKSESTKIIKRRYGGRKRTDADFRVNVSRREGICKGISFSIDGQKEISGSDRKEKVVDVRGKFVPKFGTKRKERES